MESFYGEVLRLQKLKTVEATAYRYDRRRSGVQMMVFASYFLMLFLNRRAAGSTSRDVKDNSKKLKSLQETILKMNEKNYKLQSENKSLKTDLDKLMEKSDRIKTDQAKYGDMNTRELRATVSKLEKVGGSHTSRLCCLWEKLMF